MALKTHFGGRSWTTWPEACRAWSPGLRATMPAAVHRDADRHTFYQSILFPGQWERLRAYAASRGVGIIGDAPIFVALDSVDTWQHPAVFRLDAQGQPLAVAGVPPDYFCTCWELWATRCMTGSTWSAPTTPGG